MKVARIFAAVLCAIGLIGCSFATGDDDQKAPKPQEVGYFSFEIDNVSATSATVKVTASDALPSDWIWDVAEADDVVNEEYVEVYLLECYAYQLELLEATEEEYPFYKFMLEVGLKAGTSDTYTFDDVFSPNTVYKVWACALDEYGRATYIKTKSFKTNVSTGGNSGSGGGGNDDGGEVVGGTAKIEEVYSTLTSNVSFTAEEAYMENYGAYWDDYGMASLFGHENFYLELYGPYVGEDYAYIVLELLAPAGVTTPVGTYTVGYSGQYIALSSLYVDCGNEDDSFYAGCCYGFGEVDYADFESGTVKVAKSGNNYNVTVDAKCGAHTIKMTYTGELAAFDYGDIYGQSPKLYKYHAKVHRQPMGKQRRMLR